MFELLLNPLTFRVRTDKICNQEQMAAMFTWTETRGGGQRNEGSKPGNQSQKVCMINTDPIRAAYIKSLSEMRT